MRAEHHGGLEQGFDPADPTSPPICTQLERVKQTQLAGESVPDKACGRTEAARACPPTGAGAAAGRASRTAGMPNSLEPPSIRPLLRSCRATGFDLYMGGWHFVGITDAAAGRLM